MNVIPKPGFGVLADGRSLADLIQDFASSAESTNTNLSAEGLVRLRTWIGARKLRYFVYNAKGFGNQANTVNLMKRMLQLGFTNNIELIYDTSGMEDLTVLQKLAVLLPGLNPANPQPYQLGPSTVITFFAYSENGGRKVDGLVDQLPLCINGGAEMKSEADPNLADVFKVDFYLQVQPYMWEVVNTVDNPRSLILPKGASESIILPQQESLQKALYTYRAFAMAQPPVPDWTELLQIPKELTNLNSIAVAKILSEQVAAKKITMAPVYGLYDKPLGNPVIGTATNIAFQYVTANAIAQSQGTIGNAPVVIVVLSDLMETTWQRISSFYPLAGEQPVKPTPPSSESESSEESGGEDDFGFGFVSYEEEFDETLFNVQSWCYQNGLVQPNAQTGQKGRIHVARTMAPEDLTKLLATLTGNDVLVIGAPLMPQDAFNYLYSIAGIPFMFEGQGTANLALNLGKPFFKLNTQKAKSYPSAFGNGSEDRASIISSKAAQLEKLTYDNIQLGYYDFSGGSKKGDLVVALAGVIGQMTQGADGFGTYFSEIERFYGTSANDKLLQALVFLVTTLVEDVGGQDHALRLLAATALQEGDTPLDKLYAQIENAISKGVLALIPTVIPNGPFADFLTAVIEGTDFNIGSPTSPVQVTYPASHDKITVTGRTQDFLGIPLETSVIFTMNANGKDIDTAFSLTVGEVSLAGVQWFKLDSLEVDATIPGNDNRMHGTISSKIEIGGNPVSFDLAFPSSADGKVVIDGDFSTNPPSLDSLFKLLGGLNFMTTLPPQISSVANIELRKLKFGYDFKASQINSFQLTLENNKPWPLFGKLELSNLAFDIGLVEPTGARKITWQASTNVVIGSAGGSVNVTVSYPNLTVTAGLKDGGPPIPVGDLVTFFLPDNYTINLAAVVSAFDMAVTPGEKGAATIYKVSGGLTMDADVWKLSLGIASFALTDVFLIVEGQQGETAKQTAVTGSLTANTQLDFKTDTGTDLAVPFSITAAYREKGVWFFSGKQGDQPIRVKQIIEAYLGDTWWVAGLPNLDITDLAFSIQTPEKGADPSKATSYMVGGSIRVWDTPLGDSFETVITGRFGQGQVEQTARMFARMGSRALVPVLNDAGAIVPLIGAARNSDRLAAQDGKYGVVTADILWNNIELQLYFNYAPDKRLYGFYWGILHGEIDSSTDTATMTFTEGTTLGAMVETFISWLTGSKFGLGAPWNLLNKIKLSNFKLIWNFKNNTVQFDIEIGPIDLIFARIDSFGIKYEPTGANKGVNVTLKGSFPWMDFVSADEAGTNSSDQLGWNAANPSETPAPPGGGNKYLDLRLLAAGQHIKVDGLQQAASVPKAIEILGQLPVPKDGEPPNVGFDATNNWMFGTDFGILKVESTKKDDNTLTVLVTEESGAKYTFTLQIVFTDPTLYALRIALDKDAPAAKIFAGLDFQIMYRKLSEGLGVFSAEIVLPTIMRRIDVGAVTITLPTFGVEIYTNGDFKFDIGFPWNEDFSRSFSVEAIIPPGIPVLGSGGFYFGKLPAVAVDQLPKATNGFFNPNIVFGFGAQMGLGKSIDYGILKAGFSITVFGIIEGIFAKWNPYDKVSTGGGGALALSGEYFFWLRGTFGVLGHIYGTVDFVVVKASVDVRLKVYVQITLASYEPIPVTVSAEVTASASVTINLGLFKIHLSFSFALKITETFEIGYLQNPKDAPWQVTKSTDGGRLLAPFAERMNMRSHNVFRADGLRLYWSRLEPRPEGDRSPLTAFAGFGLTVAGDRAYSAPGKPDPSQQFPAYIASLFIEGPGAAQEGDLTNMLRAFGAAGDTSFDLLAKMVARWAIASIQSANVTVDQVDAIQVNDIDIAGLIEALSNSASNPMPITAADVETFLGGQFKMTVSLPTEDGAAQAAYFPMPMGLGVKAPKIGTQPALDYTFGDYNAVDPDFITWLRDYFDQLAVQVQQEENPVEEATVLGTADVSVANFIQGDYFVLVMRQMLQAMREGLRDYKYPLDAGAKPNDIVSWVNTTGDLDKLGQPFSLYDLFKGNETAALTEGKVLQLPFVQVGVASGDSFTSLAGGQSYSASDLATGNASVAGILVAGVPIAYKGETYVTSGAETLSKLALRMTATVAEMLAGTDILTRADLLLPLSALTLPPHGYTVTSGDTLASVAAGHGLTVQDLAGVPRGDIQNPVGTANGDVAGLFEAGADTVLDLVYLPQFPVSVLLAEAQRTGAISHLSGMSSRYYLHGLRLPTEKITPKQQGMWVTDDNGTLTLPDFAGLYALTGQQIGIEVLPASPLSLTLTDQGSVPWMSFAGGVSELSFVITPPDDKQPDGDENYQRLKAIDTYCRNSVLAAGPRSIAASAKAGQEPARYPLSSSILWQSLAPVPFPNGPVLDDAVPRIWPLPASMVSLSSLGTDQSSLLNQPSPAFTLQTVTTDQATGLPVDADMQVFGWASSIRFVVKKLPGGAQASDAQKNTYEITGASAEDTVILERIVQYVTEDSAFASLAVGFQTASESTGEVLRAEVGPAVSFGISQSNLSTTTRPPAGVGTQAFAAPAPANLLNKPTDLIRLLWEASITRNGGFFLYYYDDASKDGLPDEAFNDKGEAELNLIVQYQPGVRLQPWMNAVATGDPIDTSETNVVAKTKSTLLSHQVSGGESLSGIVGRYNSTLVSLLETTQTPIGLTAGAVLKLANAVYQVPYDGSAPGGSLSQIASYFAMTEQDIKDANPRIPAAYWTDGLPVGTAIRLPGVDRNVGTSPGGTTLQSIADYYGTSTLALAGSNAAVPDLLASGGQVSLMTGPLAQHGSQAPGAQPVTALRDGLPAIPDDPKNPDYASSYLLNDYTLLAYRVAANADFEASNLGLPLSQQGQTTQQTNDKIRFAREMTPEDDLVYETSVPYVDLAKSRPAGDNPYDANGRLLQLEFGWNDVFGNKMVSDIDETTTAAGKLNGRASLTGYTDLVIGVAQWPSISTHWTVGDTSPVSDDFVITVEASFDPQPYLPDVNDKSDGWKAKARAGLQTVTSILNQIADPSGLGFSVETTLLPDPVPVPEAQILPASNAATLAAWLTAIQSFLTTQTGPSPVDKFDGKTAFTMTVQDKKSKVPAAEVFELGLDLILTRTSGVAEGDFAAIPGVRTARSTVAPLADVGSAVDGLPGDGNVLASFAEALRETLSVQGQNTLTVATGTNRYATGAGVTQAAVWAVRLGQAGSDTGIGFTVADPGKPEIFAPEPVSNTLITRTVDIYPYSALQDYDPATNTFTTKPAAKAFSGIDADSWVKEFFAFFDTILSPEYSSSILVIDARASNKPVNVDSFLKALTEQKEMLAGVASNLMAEVYQGQPGTRLASAREALRQSLLERLSNLYTTRAAVSFGADVSARIPQNPDEKTPQLYGNLQWVSDPQKLASLVTLTSPKMPLADGANQPITFLLQAPQVLKVDGTVVDEIDLDLRYAGAALEHQIAAVPGVEGNYYASSWLSPVDDAFAPLAGELGSFKVPILLRGFPSTPRMEAQTGVPTHPAAAKLSDLTQWSYGLTYSLDFHYPQDRVYATVLYNVMDSGSARLKALTDAFQGLAQFIVSQQAMVELINANVPQISAATTDQKKIDDAALALGAFLKMATDITTQASGTGQAAEGGNAGSLKMVSGKRALTSTGSYKFYIEENTETFKSGGDDVTAWVVTLTSMDGAPPAELTGDPEVRIEDYTQILVPALTDEAKGIYAYAYQNGEGAWAEGAVLQGIAARKVLLPGLQILDQQDAISVIYLTQNEDVGGKINTPFVYQTPSVSFGNPYHPTISTAQPVDIATLGSPGGGQAQRSLDAQLTALFTALFEGGFKGVTTIQFDVAYSFAFTSGLNGMAVTIPVAVLPPMQVTVPGTAGGTPPPIADLVKTLSAAIQDWSQAYAPSRQNGLLSFNLTIMSNLTKEPMPLLNLMKLELNVDDIVPPLPNLN
ncbi:LysM peptidoglycan-binding domain-containing protein [Roseibium sp. M-1]